MAAVGQKRSHPDETESSDIDEDELLANDDEVSDITCDLSMDKLQLLSDDDDDGEIDGIHNTGKPAPRERGLNLRPYQEELARFAIRGENTIVYAATGAGKTRVAFYIVKKHLEKNPAGKVAIMADKTFLVNQHHLALKKLLPEYQDETMCMSSQIERSDELHLLIDTYRIVILTPAIIENTMKRHGDNFMCKFSLLVFDECHHAQKKTNYNRLMTRYHMLKNQGKTLLPQILGLTATLGTNKANSVEKAKEHALKVMANLDVSKISTVVNNATDYERFRSDIKIERIVLQESGSDDAVHQCIEKYMMQTECLVCTTQDDLGILDSDEVELASVLKKKESMKRNDPQYITWTGELSNKAISLLGKRRSIANKVIIGASYLKIYSEVLDVNDDLTNHFAAKALEKKLNIQQLGSYSQSQDESEMQLSQIAKELVSDLANICTSAQRGKRINLLLGELKHCSSENEDGARFIVYVKTREQSEMLTELLLSEGYKCAGFTGSSATTDIGGTSRLDQESVVKQFGEGKIQGLIATTILEEGLDIHDCNFVIKYNHIGNEISTRQTKGRIRAKEGKYTVISDYKGTLRETLNIQRGILMDNAMEDILGMREDDVRAFISREQNTIVQNERNKQENVAKKVPKLDNSKYKMICAKCGKFEVNCSTLRCINGQHYVAVQPDIWESVSTRPFSKQQRIFDAAIMSQAKLFGAGGNSCTHELGIVSTYKDVRLPFLSYKFLRVKDTETNKAIKLSKWSDAPFHIPDIVDPDDLLAMQNV